MNLRKKPFALPILSIDHVMYNMDLWNSENWSNTWCTSMYY